MQVGDAVFYYPLDNFYQAGPRRCEHIGLLHMDGNGDEWVLSKLGPDHGVYKHKAAGALPWYGIAYIYRRPSAAALAAYVATGGVAEVRE